MVRETVDDVETALADLAMVVGPLTRAALLCSVVKQAIKKPSKAVDF